MERRTREQELITELWWDGTRGQTAVSAVALSEELLFRRSILATFITRLYVFLVIFRSPFWVCATFFAMRHVHICAKTTCSAYAILYVVATGVGISLFSYHYAICSWTIHYIAKFKNVIFYSYILSLSTACCSTCFSSCQKAGRGRTELADPLL